MKENKVFWWENEELDSYWEYWYLAGINGFNPKKTKKGDSYNGIKNNKQELQQMWLDELERRKSLKLPEEEKYLIEKIKQEKKFGIKWKCCKCYKEYRVKTPFRELYCFDCLGKLLKETSVLPLMKVKTGYWILEE